MYKIQLDRFYFNYHALQTTRIGYQATTKHFRLAKIINVAELVSSVFEGLFVGILTLRFLLAFRHK